MNLNQWREAFQDQGLLVVALTQDHNDPATLIVCLDGHQGHWAGGVALDTIKSMPGVVGAVSRPQAPAIIRVWTT